MNGWIKEWNSHAQWFTHALLDMKKEELEKTIKAVKIRAVAQFATAHNNEAHDKQWALAKAPNPNKEVCTQIVVSCK